MIPRKPESVFPDPVGEESSTDRPAAMSGMQSRCPSVGRPKRSRNHAAVDGWRESKKASSVSTRMDTAARAVRQGGGGEFRSGLGRNLRVVFHVDELPSGRFRRILAVGRGRDSWAPEGPEKVAGGGARRNHRTTTPE